MVHVLKKRIKQDKLIERNCTYIQKYRMTQKGHSNKETFGQRNEGY